MTATITGTLKTNTGQPLSRVNLVFVLTGAYDVVGSSVIANSPYRTKTDTSGTFSVVLNVNEDGLLGTYYKLQIPDVGASIPFTIPTGTTTADIIDLVDVSAASVSATALIVIVENYLSDAATITAIDDADMVWVWDDSAGGLRQITYANFTDGLGGGGGSLPSSTDGQILVSNAGTYASVTLSGHATIDNTGAVTLSSTALNSWLSGKTTDNLAQGATNKYYADSLVTAYVQALTAKATVVAGDKLAMMDSEASDAPKYMLASTLATYMQSALTFAASSHTHAVANLVSGGSSGYILYDNGTTPAWSNSPTLTSLTVPLVALGTGGQIQGDSASYYISFSSNSITLSAAQVFFPGNGGNVAFGTYAWLHANGSVSQRGASPKLDFLNSSSSGNGWRIEANGNDLLIYSHENYSQAAVYHRFKFERTGVFNFLLPNNASANTIVGALQASYTSDVASSERGIWSLKAVKTGTLTTVFQTGYDASGNPVTAFNEASPVTKQTITGSRGGNAALANLLTALALQGLIVDNTTKE